MRLIKLKYDQQQGHPTKMQFASTSNAANVQLSIFIKKKEKRGRTGSVSVDHVMNNCEIGKEADAERGIKLRVIRHNPLLALYQTAYHSSAPSFMKQWEGTNQWLGLPAAAENSSSFRKFREMLLPPSAALTMLYLKKPV